MQFVRLLPPTGRLVRSAHVSFFAHKRVANGILMLGKLALPEIRELILARDDDTLREVVNRWLSADLAELVEAMLGATSKCMFCG